jgi:hypothetical protein
MLRVAAYLAGGVAVLLAMDFVAATSGVLGPVPTAQAESAVATGVNVDRSSKGDRLTVLRPAYSSQRTVASGDHDALFRANPANVTVIVKGTGSSKANVRPRVDPASVQSPEAAPQRKMLDGCDPSFSPVAAPSLSHITGRCIAEIQGASKLAALH